MKIMRRNDGVYDVVRPESREQYFVAQGLADYPTAMGRIMEETRRILATAVFRDGDRDPSSKE